MENQESISLLKKKPGFVEFKQVNGRSKLDDLWFMVGSRCNLSCTHCYVNSNPTNDLLEQLSLDDIKPLLLEASKYDVENIYFTGGEPFINKDIMLMISESLKFGNVTILTNATFPIIRFLDNLKILNENNLKNNGNKLTFRISLDHYDREKHDAIRGKGNFELTCGNVEKLFSAGFKPIITSTAVVYEGNTLSEKEIEGKYLKLFKEKGVEVEVKLLPFTLEMGSNVNRIKGLSKHVFVSENCMNIYKGPVSDFQCHNGRTIEKINGKLVVYPCPIIYNDKAFELGEKLSESFKKVFLTHKACFDFCYKSGGKCTN